MTSNGVRDEIMGRLTVDVDLANYEDLVKVNIGALVSESVRRVRCQAVVDTGATHLILPERVVQELGLTPYKRARVIYADNRTAERTMVQGVRVELLDRDGEFQAIIEPGRETALIGAIVLETLDLMVDCKNQKLVPQHPEGIVAIIE